MVEYVDITHGHVRPYHGSAVLIGSSTESLLNLIIFEQHVHGFGDGIRILELAFQGCAIG